MREAKMMMSNVLLKTMKHDFKHDARNIENLIGELSLSLNDVAGGLLEKINEKIMDNKDIENEIACIEEIARLESYYTKVMNKLKVNDQIKSIA